MSTNTQDDQFVNENQYSINEIFYLFKKHFKLISIIFLFITFASIYYTLIKKPVYHANAVIMVSEDRGSMSMLDIGLGKDRNYIENEIQLLQSRTTSENVINRLLSSQHKNNLYLFGTRKYEPGLYRKILTFGLLDRFNNEVILEYPYDDTLVKLFTNRLLGSIKINSKRNTDAITISITSKDPAEASLLVNTLIDVYMNRDLEWATGEMSHLKTFLTEQLSIKEVELNKIEKKLKEFQEKEKIFSLDANSNLLLEDLTGYETQYNNILAEINIVGEREEYIKKQLNSDEKILSENISNTINQRLFSLKSEMGDLEGEIISTSSQYGESHSAVLDLNKKLKVLKSKIEEETRDLILRGISVQNPIIYRQSLMDSVIHLQFTKATLKSRSESYGKLVDKYDNILSSLPEKMLEFSRLDRVRSIHAETYSFMQKKLEEARIGEASKLGKIRIIDKAIPNRKPIKPNKELNFIFGAFLGLVLGISIVIIIEFFDNTIKSIEQVERRNISILALIPAIGVESKKKKTKKYIKANHNVEKLQRRLITHEDPKSPISEAYRGLRTSLMYTKANSTSNIILVSSSGPGEGKTTTVANLAITYANLNKRTLLVDSDLRKPVLHNVFSKDKSPGLTSYLSNNSTFDEVINKTDIDNLDIVTSGVIPPNPSELLDSKKMDTFIEEAKSKYDFILFDTPPLVAVTDAYVLLKHINQFVLVVRPGITQTGAFNRVITDLKHTNLNVDGVVMNAMSNEHSYGAGYYYNYYQYYYNENEK